MWSGASLRNTKIRSNNSYNQKQNSPEIPLLQHSHGFNHNPEIIFPQNYQKTKKKEHQTLRLINPEASNTKQSMVKV
jgi:hypothetical protein